MRHGAVGHHYLVARGTQEESSRIIQSYHTHTEFESENRLDLKSIREIDGVGKNWIQIHPQLEAFVDMENMVSVIVLGIALISPIE